MKDIWVMITYTYGGGVNLWKPDSYKTSAALTRRLFFLYEHFVQRTIKAIIKELGGNYGARRV